MLELLTLKTFVYIDASNIRNALRKSHFEIDFLKLYDYIKQKYEHLDSVKYFEGFDSEDEEKKKLFDSYEKVGMTMHLLSRKSYTSPAKFVQFSCEKCKSPNKVQVFEEKTTFKSNIDVFLSTEIFSDIIQAREPLHLVIVSCDGDYAEMIKKILELYPKTYVTVVATPFKRFGNYLSARLSELKQMERYHLINILTVKDKIGQKIQYQKKTNALVSNPVSVVKSNMPPAHHNATHSTNKA